MILGATIKTVFLDGPTGHSPPFWPVGSLAVVTTDGPRILQVLQLGEKFLGHLFVLLLPKLLCLFENVFCVDGKPLSIFPYLLKG